MSVNRVVVTTWFIFWYNQIFHRRMFQDIMKYKEQLKQTIYPRPYHIQSLR